MSARPPVRGRFRTDERARAAYAEGAGIYRIVPRAVCLPADVEDLAALVRWAAAERVPLVPRGAGSAMPGGNVGDGVVVDLTAMAGPPTAVRPEERRATMRAGAPLGELARAAGAHGLRLPPDPSSWRWATAGGVVATNAAGARSVRYGSVRPWVDALEIVTAEGAVERLDRAGRQRGGAPGDRFAAEVAPAIRAAAPLVRARFPATRKNSCGYALDAYLRSGDLLDLVVGSEGTLALVTEVTWRLDPVPAHQAGLRVDLAGYDRIGEVVERLLGFGPSAVELLDATFLDLVAGDGRLGPNLAPPAGTGAVLLVELEGDDPAALREALQSAAAAVRRLALRVQPALATDEAERLWALRHAASPILAGLPPERRSLQVIEDGCVPVPRLGEYVAAVRAAAERHGLAAVVFGHAGDGNVHVNLLPEVGRPGWERAVGALLEEVTDAVLRLGGVPSGEHGVGRLRAGFLERLYGPEIMELFRRVKAAFDPAGILNPGVILPGGDPPIARLKAGAGAAPLPADVAVALREIERTGRYDTPRLALADGG